MMIEIVLAILALVVGIPIAFFCIVGVYGLWAMMLHYLGIV